MRWNQNKLLFSYSEKFFAHKTGPFHPESPLRFKAMIEFFREKEVLHEANRLKEREATQEEIELAHTADYIQLVKRECEECPNEQVRILSTGDVMISKDSYLAAKYAVGACLEGIDALNDGRTTRVFCPTRPPGHHATENAGMGFCLFNNIAVSSLYAIKKHGLRKVLIVDFDVHHGNGTEAILSSHPEIFYYSTHLHPHYPGTGLTNPNSKGTIYNRPIENGPKARDQVLTCYEEELPSLMEMFRPEIVLISAGFDAHAEDPLGNLGLSVEDFSMITQSIVRIANRTAGGRILSALEGGYHIEALKESALAHVIALSEKGS